MEASSNTFQLLQPDICKLCGSELEDIEHIILPRCPLLLERKGLLLKYARDRLTGAVAPPECAIIFEAAISQEKPEKTVQFFLDPSALPEVIKASRKGENVLLTLFIITSTCYFLHRLSLQLLGNVR